MAINDGSTLAAADLLDSWVATGLTITPGTNWAINSYALRQTVGKVIGWIQATYSGATLTVSAAGVVPGVPVTVATLPTGWVQTGLAPSVPIPGYESTPSNYRSWSTRVTASTVQLLNGTPGQTLVSGCQIRFYVDFYTI